MFLTACPNAPGLLPATSLLAAAPTAMGLSASLLGVFSFQKTTKLLVTTLIKTRYYDFLSFRQRCMDFDLEKLVINQKKHNIFFKIFHHFVGIWFSSRSIPEKLLPFFEKFF
jgi:hypothetical protein